MINLKSLEFKIKKRKLKMKEKDYWRMKFKEIKKLSTNAIKN